MWPVFAKVFRFLPDIRSGKQIFFTSSNKNLPDRIKIAVLVEKHKQKQTTYRITVQLSRILTRHTQRGVKV